jgi:hypothetical protein
LFFFVAEIEPIADERARALIDEELKSFGIKQGDSVKTIEELNTEFVKNHFNSLAHRDEGKHLPDFSNISLPI